MDGKKIYWLTRNITTGEIRGRDGGQFHGNPKSVSACFRYRSNAENSIRHAPSNFELIPVTVEVTVHTDKPEAP